LKHVAPAAQRPIAEIAQVETVWLMTRRAHDPARVKCAVRPSFLVALRASKSDLREALGMRIVARDAVSLALHGMPRGHVFVTSLAAGIAGSSHGMRFMTAAAVAVIADFVLRQGLDSLVA